MISQRFSTSVAPRVCEAEHRCSGTSAVYHQDCGALTATCKGWKRRNRLMKPTKMPNQSLIVGPATCPVFACLWCVNIDGVNLCKVCGRSLCTECMANHSCTLTAGDHPAATRESNRLLSSSTDFEALRMMRTCRTFGCRLGVALSKLDGSFPDVMHNTGAAYFTPGS